jgi:hypothetical protein
MTTSEKINRSVERIAMSREYTERKLSLGPGTHECTYEVDGRCKFCPKRASLKADGRTGELNWG